MTPAERNAALCRWLGVEPTQEFVLAIDDTYIAGDGRGWTRDKANEYRCIHDMYHCFVVPRDVYPDLATREGFWVLLEKLVARQYTPAMHAKDSGKYEVWLEGDTGENYEERERDDLPAALFSAAWALYEREHVSTGEPA